MPLLIPGITVQPVLRQLFQISLAGILRKYFQTPNMKYHKAPSLSDTTSLLYLLSHPQKARLKYWRFTSTSPHFFLHWWRRGRDLEPLLLFLLVLLKGPQSACLPSEPAQASVLEKLGAGTTFGICYTTNLETYFFMKACFHTYCLLTESYFEW